MGILLQNCKSEHKPEWSTKPSVFSPIWPRMPPYSLAKVIEKHIETNAPYSQSHRKTH
jgi:hypothetical protein